MSAVVTNNISSHNPSEKEHVLPSIQFHGLFLVEALQAILHTLIFVRAPGQVKAKDQSCTLLSPLMYSSCSFPDVDGTINTTIDMIKSSLQQHHRIHNPIIPNQSTPPNTYHILNSTTASTTSSSTSPITTGGGGGGGGGSVGNGSRGIVPYQFEILISFYEKKEVAQWYGIVSRSENIYFEHWRIPVSIIDYPLSPNPVVGGSGSVPMTVNPDFQQQYSIAYSSVSHSIMALIETVNVYTDHVPLTTYEFEMSIIDPNSKKKK